MLAGVIAGAAVATAGETWPEVSGDPADAHFEVFLDRLMRAESNGRDFAANPRSSALGPFQFIKATFIEVARRHFAELAELGDEAVLGLRTDRGYARRAAAIYSMENLASLTGKGLNPSYGHLRLAFLVGPSAAARIMQAQPDTSVVDILGASVIKANPFMAAMSASELIARTARDVGQHHGTVVAIAPEARRRLVAVQPSPRIQPRPSAKATATINASCNQKLVACRRWIAMQAKKQRVAQQQAAQRGVRKAPIRGRVSQNSAGRPGV